MILSLASLKKLTMMDLNFSRSAALVNELPAYFVIAASSVESMTMLTITGNIVSSVALMNFGDACSKQSLRNFTVK